MSQRAEADPQQHPEPDAGSEQHPDGHAHRRLGVVPKGTLLWYARRVYFKIGWTLCAIVFVLFYRYRCYGAKNVTAVKGGVMVVSSHQSHFDPVIIGLGLLNRECYALARSSLFTNPILGFIIRWFNALPVDRGEADRQAIKNCVEVLETGRALVLFPEGTRSADGSVQAFKPGVLLIQRKARAPVIPVAIAGAYSAWPRSKRFPKLFGKVSVKFGEAIMPDELEAAGREGGIRLIESRVKQLHKELCEKRGHET